MRLKAVIQKIPHNKRVTLGKNNTINQRSLFLKGSMSIRKRLNRKAREKENSKNLKLWILLKKLKWKNSNPFLRRRKEKKKQKRTINSFYLRKIGKNESQIKKRREHKLKKTI